MNRRTISILAWSPLAATIGATLVTAATGGLTRADGETAFAWGLIALALLFVVVGGLISARRPENAIGWILSMIGVLQALEAAAEAYGRYALTGQTPLPGGELALWLGAWIWIPSVGLLVTFLPLLFPDGRPPTPAWRWVARASGVGIATFAIGLAASAWPVREQLLTIEDYEPGMVAGLGILMTLTSAVGAAVALFLRFRHAEGDERQQLRWFAAAAMLTIVGLFLGFAIPADWSTWFLVPGFLLIPVATGIAVFRYRLYDLDLVIKKTVVFVILVLLLTGVFLVGALAIGGALAGSGLLEWGVAMIIVAFVIGALITPLWRVSRRIADKLVYGGRASPYEILTAFSNRMADTYSTEDVLPRMAAIVGEGTAAERVGIWLLVGSELQAEASWPAGASADAFEASGDAFDVHHRGEHLGAITLRMPANDPMNPSKERLIRDIASQAGLVLRNVKLIQELRASRRRIVEAQDVRAKKLERDIHDGAQQQLVALGVKMRLLGTLLDKDPEKAHELVDRLQTEMTGALENLRDLARGIYPPLLADKGLPDALEAQARKAAVPTSVETYAIGRYPQEVEAAVYFCALEALNNVAKYAEAAHTTVTLSQENGQLTFSVSDDGRGFDPTADSYGTGLQGMADRLDAIGGDLRVESARGRGTKVVGWVPAEVSA